MTANGNIRPRWEPRVQMAMIRRLYESDAKGLRDDDLVNEVGYALYARCRTMIEACQAWEGRVQCPSCTGTIMHDCQDETVLQCPCCKWSMTWQHYRKTLRKKKIVAPGILAPLQSFVNGFPACKSYREKIMEVDRLIHTFHHEGRKYPTSPIAKNVIEGNVQEIVKFLDDLAYSDNTTPELLTTIETYRATLALAVRNPRTGERHSSRAKNSIYELTAILRNRVPFALFC